MKTEQEIRKLRAALKKLHGKPCVCKGLAKIICQQQRQEVGQIHGILSWVLDEHHDFERAVENIIAAASRETSCPTPN